MKKKIIFITEALWIGGIESALTTLLRQLDEERFDVTLLVLRASLEMADRLPAHCKLIVADRENKNSFSSPYRFCRLFHLTEKCERPSALHRLACPLVPLIRWIENRCYIRYIRQKMKEQSYDTAVIYSDRTAETAVRAIRAHKYLMFYHHGAMRKEYHDEIAYKKCEKIIVVSKTKAEELKVFRPKYAAKVTWLHNLVDSEYILERSRESIQERFPAHTFRLVTCGRLSPPKGIDWAASACNELIKRGIKDVQWWIVGDGPEREALEKQIRELGVAPYFLLLGMRDNPYAYLALADLVVQPSRFENDSVVIREALALGKPILATVPAGREQITDGVNGFLCDADPKGIADGIEKLKNHPDDLAKATEYLKQSENQDENNKTMQTFYQWI